MTTTLTKPVSRVVGVIVKDGPKRRALVVTMHAEFLTLRLQGTRREETVSLEACYFHAVKSRVFKDRMDKAKTRKARIGGRK